jgi:hypothetical protein
MDKTFFLPKKPKYNKMDLHKLASLCRKDDDQKISDECGNLIKLLAATHAVRGSQKRDTIRLACFIIGRLKNRPEPLQAFLELCRKLSVHRSVCLSMIHEGFQNLLLEILHGNRRERKILSTSSHIVANILAHCHGLDSVHAFYVSQMNQLMALIRAQPRSFHPGILVHLTHNIILSCKKQHKEYMRTASSVLRLVASRKIRLSRAHHEMALDLDLQCNTNLADQLLKQPL